MSLRVSKIQLLTLYGALCLRMKTSKWLTNGWSLVLFSLLMEQNYMSLKRLINMRLSECAIGQDAFQEQRKVHFLSKFLEMINQISPKLVDWHVLQPILMQKENKRFGTNLLTLRLLIHCMREVLWWQDFTLGTSLTFAHLSSTNSTTAS